MNQMKFRPSQFQEALACYALANSIEHQHSLWQLEPAIGKSVIKHVIALHTICSNRKSCVHMVNPNSALSSRDDADFADMRQIGDLNGKIVYHSDLSFHVKKSHMVIIDEADCFVFQEMAMLKKLMQKCTIICLTASTPDQNESELEAQIFAAMNLKCFSFERPNKGVPHQHVVVQTLPQQNINDFIKFVEKKSEDMAVVIYTRDAQVLKLVQRVPGARMLTLNTGP